MLGWKQQHSQFLQLLSIACLRFRGLRGSVICFPLPWFLLFSDTLG